MARKVPAKRKAVDPLVVDRLLRLKQPKAQFDQTISIKTLFLSITLTLLLQRLQGSIMPL
jgi:hypothetical protein